MPIVNNRILKRYVILCKGKDAKNFLICNLESDVLKYDKRFTCGHCKNVKNNPRCDASGGNTIPLLSFALRDLLSRKHRLLFLNIVIPGNMLIDTRNYWNWQRR